MTPENLGNDLGQGSALRKIRAVILGGGHAGYRAARRLIDLRKPSDRLEVILVSAETSEVYHGLMPQIVGGRVQPAHILVPLRQYLPGVAFYHNQVERIDLGGRKVYLDPGQERAKIEISYDYLVIALGSVTDLARFPGLQEHGLQTKTIGDVCYLHDHLLETLERASVEGDPAERRRLLTFLVAGAGYAGIEIGSEAYNLLCASLRFYPGMRREELDFTIVASTDRILPSMHPRLARSAAAFLARTGVRVRLNTTIEGANAGEALLSTGERIAAGTIIVTSGIGPNPVLAALPVQMDRGRIVTDEYCRVPGFPGVYAVGDNSATPHYRTGQPCPATALYAFTQGPCAARNILAELRGAPLRAYRFNSFGAIALLGNRFGLLEGFGIPFSGFLAAQIVRLAFWIVVPSWRCRLGLLSDWFLSILFPRDVSQMKIARSETIVPLRFRAGQIIVHQGEPGSRFYVIQDGCVEVVRRDADGEQVLATLGPGHYFGEVALLKDCDRTATVRAVQDTSVLSIDKKDFRTLAKYLPIIEPAPAPAGKLSKAGYQ